MGRILIDTDELRSLDAMWRSGADAMASLSSHVTGALVGTRLNTDDPGLRAARLGERENEVRRRLDQAAGAFRHDGGEFVALAGRVEAEQAVGGAASLAVAAIADWTLTGAGVSAVDLGAGVLAGLTGFAMAEGALDGLRRSGLDALHGVEQAVQQGLAVGRSVMDRSMGLLHDATQSLQDAVSSVVDRVTQLAEAAWQAIWGRLSSVFQSVVAGMELLVTTTGRIFTANVDALRAVGNWVVALDQSVNGDWSFRDRALFNLAMPYLGPLIAMRLFGPPGMRREQHWNVGHGDNQLAITYDPESWNFKHLWDFDGHFGPRIQLKGNYSILGHQGNVDGDGLVGVIGSLHPGWKASDGDVGLSASLFGGLSAKGSADLEVVPGVRPGVSGGARYGLGADASVKFGFHDGVFGVDGSLGAAVGGGADRGFTMKVDVGQLLDSADSFFDSLTP